MSQEETTISKRLLLEELYRLALRVDKDEFTEAEMTQIHNTITSHASESDSVDTELLRYTFTGWWVHNSLLRKNEGQEPLLSTNDGRNLPFCPWCLETQSLSLEESGTNIRTDTD